MEKLAARFGFQGTRVLLKKRYNIAPSQSAPVVVRDADQNTLKLMRWGFVPFWAKDPAIGHKMINARAETVAEKPSFRRSFAHRRCLVLADSFYEWKSAGKNSKGRIPLRIGLQSGEPFAFAGLWDLWKDPAGDLLESFTIITTTANRLLKPVHDRMPVILRKQDETSWLDPAVGDIKKLKSILKPFDEKQMECYEVSTLVNSPKNDVPECIQPLKGLNLN